MENRYHGNLFVNSLRITSNVKAKQRQHNIEWHSMKKTKAVFEIIEKAVSLVLMFLGFFFIYKGDVINRFHLKRTNFAEYSEFIMEIPTVTTWIEYRSDYSQNLQYWNDFTIELYHWQNDSSTTSLELGENKVFGSSLHVFFENFTDGTYRISPVNYAPGMPHDFSLSYSFQSNTSNVSRIAVALSTRNNSYCGYGTEFHDGEVKEVFGSLSQRKYIVINPEKYIFNQEDKKCRGEPFHEIIIQRTLERARERVPSHVGLLHTRCAIKTF